MKRSPMPSEWPEFQQFQNLSRGRVRDHSAGLYEVSKFTCGFETASNNELIAIRCHDLS
jgi:hypothetical protein